MTHLFFAILLGGLGAAAPTAAGAPPPGALLTDPVWKARPSNVELKLYYPDRALRMGIKGAAIVTCAVGEAGTLDHCIVSGEDPKGQGFGFVMLKITQRMQMDLVSEDGTPTRGRTVKVGGNFTLSGPVLPKAGKRFDPGASWGIDLVTVQK